MHLPDVEFHDATTIAEAATLMARYAPDARLFAGGTDLVVDLKTQRIGTRHLVSVHGIEALRGLAATDDILTIGALATPAELAANATIRDRYAAILDATDELASPQIRNMATIGGNIASAVPSADLPPILIVYRAVTRLVSPTGERTVPLDSFFTGPRRTVMEPDEILTAIVLPKPPDGFGAAFSRYANRGANACAVAGVAVGLSLDDDDRIGHARITLCAVAPTPELLDPLGERLLGKRVSDELFAEIAGAASEAAVPISDVRGTADYRRNVVAVLTRRGLTTAAQRARDNR